MSHTVHGAKGLHKQAAIDQKADKHRQQIAEAAYFHAEHRGFIGGDPVADWLAAEAEINAASNKGKGSEIH